MRLTGARQGLVAAALAFGLVANAGGYVVEHQPPPASCHARGRGALTLPDPRCTPGATDRRVTQATIGETICSPGYTRRVRPPKSVTEPEKRASLRAYGERGPLRDYEYDHLIPLELGGAPNDPRNLWPEPGGSPNLKDRLENRLHALVCARRLSLGTARRAVAGNWITALHRYVR